MANLDIVVETRVSAALSWRIWPVGTDRWCASGKGLPRCLHTGYLILFTDRRVNDSGQVCEVFVGEALFVAGKTKQQRLDVIDRSGHTQFAISCRIDDEKPVTTERVSTPRYARKPQQKQQKVAYIDAEVTRCMIRGCIQGVLGVTVPLPDWLHHVATAPYDLSQELAHLAYTARWYLRWRGLRERDVVRKPQLYPDVLQFALGHAVWTYPYGADACYRTKGELLPCESFSTARWIDSLHRSGDCEDLAASILSSFYALQQTHESDDPLLEALQHLALQYRGFFVDSVIRIRETPQLHAYVRLVPAPNISLPHIMLDSTHRGWACPELTHDAKRTLELLYRYMRICACGCGKCQLCRDADLADAFAWASPFDLWQRVSRGMYMYELRYYEPSSRRVYAPVSRGLLGTETRKAEYAPWLEITDEYLSHGEAFNMRDQAHMDPEHALWPPVPGIAFDQPHEDKDNDSKDLREYIPVFLREADVTKLFGDDAAAAQKWLETHCAQKLRVYHREKQYVHAPGLYNWVFYVGLIKK